MKSALTIKWMSKFLWSLVLLNPKLRKAVKLKKTGVWENYKPFVDETLLNWLNPLIDYAGINYVVKGKENVPVGEPVIYAPTHQGLFDFPAVIQNIISPAPFVSKIEALKLPIVRKWMYVMDCVFIDRKNKRAAHSTLESAINMVKSGRSMIIFPEGTRSKDGQLGKFRGGVVKISMESGAKIVPMLIEGTRERFEATGNIVPGTVYVTFLPPVDTTGMTRETSKALPDEIRAMIAAEREKQRKETGITSY